MNNEKLIEKFKKNLQSQIDNINVQLETAKSIRAKWGENSKEYKQIISSIEKSINSAKEDMKKYEALIELVKQSNSVSLSNKAFPETEIVIPMDSFK